MAADVAFKDLGLVVIDENKRFGLLKRKNLNTPATRGCPDLERDADSSHTLPALTGARDMSTLNTLRTTCYLWRQYYAYMKGSSETRSSAN